jgi:CheY-like chemotaxis protein/anti-sigma regulatory factor (Ser/Thr protein kinase)
MVSFPASGQPEAAPAATGGKAGDTPILIVDDSLLDRRVAGRLLEKRSGWRALFANNGAEALTVLERNCPRAVLTDLRMPEMDGLTLVQQVRAKHPQVPVVLMTGNGSEELAVRALQAGAASYVPKQLLASHLEAALEQVLSASQLEVHRRRMLACLTQRDSRFYLENDATLIPPLVALVQEDLLALQLCDATGATRVGIALQEALLNALYHGNLEIGPGLYQQGAEALAQAAAQRRRLAPYRERRIRLFANVSHAEAVYVVMDQGPGFDPSILPESTDPANLCKGTGRGVILMRTFMDRVLFNTSGNQVTLIKRRERKDD